MKKEKKPTMVTAGDIWVLGNLCAQAVQAAPPIHFLGALWIARTLKALSTEMETIEKARVGLVKKFTEGLPEGSPVPDEHVEEFNKAFGEILGQEIPDVKIKLIRASLLAGLPLTPGHAMVLERYVIDD